MAEPQSPSEAQALPAIGERIRMLRGAEARDRFAERLGVSRNTLMRYEQAQRCPDALFLQRLCSVCAVDPRWLLLGEGSHRADAAEPDPEFALIPLYGVEVSAGHGATFDDEEPLSRLAFRQDWLRHMGLMPERVVGVQARGDSMEPTLHDGDLLLVDTAQRALVNDAIYVVRQDGLLFVKRLQRMLDGSVQIHSDNPAYSPELVARQAMDALAVIGRVVWSGGRI